MNEKDVFFVAIKADSVGPDNEFPMVSAIILAPNKDGPDIPLASMHARAFIDFKEVREEFLKLVSSMHFAVHNAANPDRPIDGEVRFAHYDDMVRARDEVLSQENPQ